MLVLAGLVWPGLLWSGLLANFKSRQGTELTLAGSGSGLATNKLLSAVKATDRAVLTPQPHVTTLPPCSFHLTPLSGLRSIQHSAFCACKSVLRVFVYFVLVFAQVSCYVQASSATSAPSRLLII